MLNKISEQIICRANQLLKEKQQIIIAIDGRCGSGKSTLAALLKEKTGCNVIHADDFFLRPEQRTEERLSEIGGNIDYERLSEVLETLKKTGVVSYKPYNCSKKALDEPITTGKKPIAIIEGSYSCHPELWKFCDLHIFLTAPSDVQLQRLKSRNPSLTERFKNEWIPMEERYFEAMGIAEKCEMIFET